MGGPTSSPTSEVYMQTHDKLRYIVWGRIADDVYSIPKGTHLENFFHHMNTLHHNIRFSKEEKSNGEVEFLDISSLFNKAYSVITNKDNLTKKNPKLKQVLK